MMAKESFEKINYSLRISKNIERKMIAEVLKRLTVFDKIENYKYIGLGSTFFSDFSLFHKVLGISNMISIERAEDKKERFEFNKPFSCIEMKYKSTNDILSTLDLLEKNVCWLDFDDKLNSDMLSDINTYVTKCSSGCIFMISVNVQTFDNRLSQRIDNEVEEEIINSFKESFVSKQTIESDGFAEESASGNDLRIEDVKKTDLFGIGMFEYSRKIINNEVIRSIKRRKEHSPINYKQIFNFDYNDGARMLTLGYIFYSDEDIEKFNKCEFEDFNFCKFEKDRYQIKVPSLTYKELGYINSNLPNCIEEIDNKIIPMSDINKYKESYRFFPSYMESFS